MATNFNYTTNIPLATHKPSADQPNMQTNTNSISSIIGVDHLTFNTATGSQSDGMHKVIRQPTGPGTQNFTRAGPGAVYANTPANITEINQVIAGEYTPDTAAPTTDTQLFNITGLGGISQLTGNLASSDGWCWCGGILLQWGFVSSTARTASNTVTFKNRVVGAIPFPNNCFIVNATLSVNNNATSTNIRSAQIVIDSLTVSNTSFTWAYNFDQNGIATGFYWLAIGN